MNKHLWEIEHEYYCNNGNYRSNDCGFYYDSWQDFFKEWGDSDLDYNLLFRWDWIDKDKENEENGEELYDSDKLKIYWMLQRKGDYNYCIVNVTKEDETKVIEFLKPRWEYMKKLWSPFE